MSLSFKGVLATLLAVAPFLRTGSAQSSTPAVFTDPETGIIFDTYIVPDSSSTGGMTIGFAFPEDALDTDADEYIGLLTCSISSTTETGWCGISLGGSMTNSLLLMAWPNDDEILTSLRFATGYDMPAIYTGDATVTQISSTINSTHYTLLYRCQNCLSWNQGGSTGSASTSTGGMMLGWCQNKAAPGGNPACPSAVELTQHDNGQSIFRGTFGSDAANPSYTSWAALATSTVIGSCGGSGGGNGTNGTMPTATATATTTATPTATGIPVPTDAYDYIVIGGGAGGIPIADKLSEAGNSVLLIEKGPPSSGRWEGTLKPDWLNGTNLTRFDVPGLCNEIWKDAGGISCDDTDQMAGCVLGGGTAVNAGLWWKPNPEDWDYNFPAGWKSTDMVDATQRVFSRIPGTDTPSMDGKRYRLEGFNVISGGLEKAGWKSLTLNNEPTEKNHTFGHTPYMFSHGERGGPMATYLLSASKRSNFAMWTNTQVRRVIREGGHVTGVEVQPFRGSGYSGIVNVTCSTGRVILSAGTFGSAKLLMRSGIGPADQLSVVSNSTTDGPTMIKSTSWIDLPVGSNLVDHVNTDTVVKHDDVVFYDFYAAYDNPIASDASSYLKNRTGILAQSAPNIGPMFFDEIEGADGITRSIQWTARVEGSHDTPNGKAMTMSQYLGRGATSRGRMTITSGLSTVVSTQPYLHDENDVAAVIQGIKNLQAALKGVAGLTWAYPAGNTTVEDFVNDMLVSYTNRRSNHWMGTNKMGTDDGRIGGSAVVDTDAKVYGTDNLFVVDASIFPGMVTTNPTAYIVTASEHAAGRILELEAPAARPLYQQCGGRNYTGSFQCEAPYRCQRQNAYYWQCVE